MLHYVGAVEVCGGQIGAQIDLDVGGSGKLDFTFAPSGGVAAFNSQRQKCTLNTVTSFWLMQLYCSNDLPRAFGGYFTATFDI